MASGGGLLLNIIAAFVIMSAMALGLVVFADVYRRIGLGESVMPHTLILYVASALVMAVGVMAIAAIFYMIRRVR